MLKSRNFLADKENFYDTVYKLASESDESSQQKLRLCESEVNHTRLSLYEQI